MSLFKDIKNYFSFKRIIKSKRVELESNFNIRIDNADRLYTVLNVPTDAIGEAYDLKKSDVDRISESYIREYVSKLSTYLNSIGLSELYDFYEPVKKVEKYSYLIIIGYKQLDSLEINKIIYRILLPILSFLSFMFIIKLIFF
jgi:hypothetical protein